MDSFSENFAWLDFLFQPFYYFFSEDKRVYWPYLLATFFLVLAFYFIRNTKEKLKIKKEDLINPSTILDFKLFLTHAWLKKLLALTGFLSTIGIAIFFYKTLNEVFGTPSPSSQSIVVVNLFYSISLFLISDFSRFFLHRLFHKIPFLWEIHKLHHSATTLTPLSLYRVHPLETLIFSLRKVLVVGLVSGFFFYTFGEKAQIYSIFGINFFAFIFNILGSNLRHSSIELSFGPVLEKFFISPAQHQIHHQKNPRFYTKNFGSFLAIWDRIYGSLLVFNPSNKKEFGLPKNQKNHLNDLKSALIHPLSFAFGQIIRPKSGKPLA